MNSILISEPVGYSGVHPMYKEVPQVIRTSIKDFRKGLAGYIDSGEVVQVTRNGKLVGVFMPRDEATTWHGIPIDPDPAAFSDDFAATGGRLRKELLAQGIDPEDLIADAENMAAQERAERAALRGKGIEPPARSTGFDEKTRLRLQRLGMDPDDLMAPAGPNLVQSGDKDAPGAGE
jgi:hypothetical protein